MPEKARWTFQAGPLEMDGRKRGESEGKED